MKGGNDLVDSPLITKSKEFALQIIKVCNYVKQTKKESVLTNHLSVAGQVSVQIFVRLFMVMELPILLPSFKLHSKNALKVSIG